MTAARQRHKHLALCGNGEGAAAFLVRRVHVNTRRRGGDPVVLVHVGALVAQPLVAERAQALGERGLRTLGAALEGGESTEGTKRTRSERSQVSHFVRVIAGELAREERGTVTRQQTAGQ